MKFSTISFIGAIAAALWCIAGFLDGNLSAGIGWFTSSILQFAAAGKLAEEEEKTPQEKQWPDVAETDNFKTAIREIRERKL